MCVTDKGWGHYDPLHRNPLYCHADRECMWELRRLASHHHQCMCELCVSQTRGGDITTLCTVTPSIADRQCMCELCVSQTRGGDITTLCTITPSIADRQCMCELCVSQTRGGDITTLCTVTPSIAMPTVSVCGSCDALPLTIISVCVSCVCHRQGVGTLRPSAP